MTTQTFTPVQYLDPTNLAATAEIHRMGLEFLGWKYFPCDIKEGVPSFWRNPNGRLTRIGIPPLNDNFARLVREKLEGDHLIEGQRCPFGDKLEEIVFGEPINRLTESITGVGIYRLVNAAPLQQLVAAMIAVGRVK